MFDKMKQLMEMKKQADIIKKQLDSMEIEVSEVRGINLTVTGSQNFRAVQIDQELLNSDNKVKLENDLLRSLNAAIKKSQTEAARQMQSVMPGL